MVLEPLTLYKLMILYLLKQVKSMGIQNVIDAYQSAYARYLSR